MRSALAIVLAFVPGLIAAQSSLRGIITDSLRAVPLGGALVSIEGTALRTRSDARGRYEFRSLAPGVYRLTVQSPYLDSMLLGALSATVEIRRSSHELNVATMSVAQYHRAVCGGVLPAGQGAVIGIVTTASGNTAVGQHVAAIWNEAVFSSAGAQGALRGSVDTTDSNGFFAVCGVPIESGYQIRGGDDEMGTAILTMPSSPARVRRRDLRIGVAGTVVTVRGRLATASGTGLQGDVELTGDTTARVRTAATGEFVLSISERSSQAWVRVIGYTPRYLNLEPAGDEIDLGDVVLESVPHELEGWLIEGRLVSREEFEFEERRKTGIGSHFDSTFIARFPRITASVLSNHSRHVKQSVDGRIQLRRAIGLSGADGCFPRVWIDGLFMGATGSTGRGVRSIVIPPEVLTDALNRAKRIELYPATQAPAGFTDFDGCGALIVWTR